MNELVSKYRLPVIETYNSLTFLQREGYIEFTEEINNPPESISLQDAMTFTNFSGK